LMRHDAGRLLPVMLFASSALRVLSFQSPACSHGHPSPVHVTNWPIRAAWARVRSVPQAPLRSSTIMQASSDSAGMQVLTMDTVEIEAMTFDLDDTLYDNLPVIKKAVATMFSELEERYPKIKVAPDDFRAEMIGRQKSLSPDGGADLGALRHRSRALPNFYVRTYVHTCIHTHIHTCKRPVYVPIYVRTYTHTHTHTHTCMQETYTYQHTYVHTHTHTCIHACMHAYIHKNIHPQDYIAFCGRGRIWKCVRNR
jgi:hypothetical protein